MFEIDAGAAFTVIGESLNRKHFASYPPDTAKIRLRSGEMLRVIGYLKLKVTTEEQTLELLVYIVSGEGPPVLGHSWLESSKLDWATTFRSLYNIRDTRTSSAQQHILSQHSEIFKSEPETLKDIKAAIQVVCTVAAKYAIL